MFLAVNVGLPIGRPFGKGFGWGTGWLLDTQGHDRAPCVKLLFEQKQESALVEVFCTYEPQLAGMLPQNYRR